MHNLITARMRTLIAAVAVLMAAPVIGGFASQARTQAPTVSPTHARIETRTYDFKDAGVPMTYELFVPTTYDPARPSPLIMALHGLGSNARTVIRYQGLTDLAEARGYLVVAATGYNSRGWYGSRGDGRYDTRGDAANDPQNLGALSEKDVMNVLAIVRAAFNVDPKGVFLFGHSMGGAGTLHIGMKHPTMFAALGAVAPAIYSNPDSLVAIRDVPVMVIQGDEDNLVDVAVTRRWVAKMKALGMTHAYVEIPGGDHSRLITRTPANMQKIFDFFDRARKGATSLLGDRP